MGTWDRPRSPSSRCEGHRHSWGARKPSLPSRLCQTGAPSHWGSWRFLPALPAPPPPPRCPPPEPGPCPSPVSPSRPPNLSTSPGSAGAAPRVLASLHGWLTFARRVERSVTGLQLRASLGNRGHSSFLAVSSSQVWAVIPRPVWRSVKTQHQFFLLGCTSSQLQQAGSGSLTRDCSPLPTLGAQTCSHWTTREVLRHQLLKTQPVAAIQTQGLQRRGEGGLGVWSCREAPLLRDSAGNLSRTRGNVALGAAG